MKTAIRGQRTAIRFAVAALVLAAGAARAQNFAIGWHTMAGGGGASTGATYSVTGTLGQPAAGIMAGGNYALAGGFWGGVGLVPMQARATPHLTRPRAKAPGIAPECLLHNT